MPHRTQPLLVAFLVVMTAACATDAEGDPAGDADATAKVMPAIGAWTVDRIGGEPVVDGSPAYLEFGADGALFGNASINRMNCNWTFEAGRLAMGPAMTTKMGGPPELMDQERRLIRALGEVVSVQVENATLTLRDAAGDEVIAASRRASSAAR